MHAFKAGFLVKSACSPPPSPPHFHLIDFIDCSSSDGLQVAQWMESWWRQQRFCERSYCGTWEKNTAELPKHFKRKTEKGKWHDRSYIWIYHNSLSN